MISAQEADEYMDIQNYGNGILRVKEQGQFKQRKLSEMDYGQISMGRLAKGS